MVLDTDVVVIGAGSVGSMASWQLAARGLRVIGIDRFMVPGPFSAYAGESRVFRMVYMEGGQYTPLLQRARDLWRELEAASGTELLTVTGVVTITDHDHPVHAALLRAGRERGLSFEDVIGTGGPAAPAPAPDPRRRRGRVRSRGRLRAQRAGRVLRPPAGPAARRLVPGPPRGPGAGARRRPVAGPHRSGGGPRAAGAGRHRHRRRAGLRRAGHPPGRAPPGADLVSRSPTTSCWPARSSRSSSAARVTRSSTASPARTAGP